MKKMIHLSLLVLALAMLGTACQPQVAFETLTDTASLPVGLQKSVAVLAGKKGHFPFQPGHFVLRGDKETYIWLQSLDYPMQVKDLMVKDKVLTITVEEGTLGTAHTSFAIAVRGTHEQVKVVDLTKGQDFPLLCYEETITGLIGTFMGSNSESNEVYIQIDQDIAWPANSSATAFVVPPPLRAELEQLVPDYHRISLDTVMRDSEGNLHIVDHTVEESKELSIDVAFERYAAYYEPQDLPGVSFASFEQEIAHEQEPRRTMVTAHRGEAPSTGYGIRIEKILTDGAGLYDVHVTYLDPAQGSVQSDVITYPVDTVLIAGWDPHSRFRLVVDGVLKGPFDHDEIHFVAYNYTPENMTDELGIVTQELVYQTQGVDTAIAVHRGKCPTTGYDIEITRITISHEGLVSVYVRLTDPPKGSMQAQVITQPFDSVRIAGHRATWQYRVIVDE